MQTLQSHVNNTHAHTYTHVYVYFNTCWCKYCSTSVLYLFVFCIALWQVKNVPFVTSLVPTRHALLSCSAVMARLSFVSLLSLSTSWWLLFIVFVCVFICVHKCVCKRACFVVSSQLRSKFLAAKIVDFHVFDILIDIKLH